MRSLKIQGPPQKEPVSEPEPFKNLLKLFTDDFWRTNQKKRKPVQEPTYFKRLEPEPKSERIII